MKIQFLTLTFLILFRCLLTEAHTAVKPPKHEPVGTKNVAYQWAKMALTATANDTDRNKPRPTVTSRYLGLIFVSIFDAWSRYDAKATPVFLTKVDRRPTQERSLKNKEMAISYAAYHTLMEYYPADSILYKQLMIQLGYLPNNSSNNPKSAQGIGQMAAQATIDKGKHDGSNQYGEEEGSGGTPYYNYTHYNPVNNVDTLTDPNRWQPKYFSDGKGGQFAPVCLTPYWHKVKPIGLQSAHQFRPGPPPLFGSEQLKNEVKEVVELQAGLTNEQRALVEFMRDGPSSVQQAGHWLLFAQFVSRRDNHTLDQDVKMYFLNQVTAMDAFIACWDSKMTYDFARPFALVHEYYRNKKIRGWAGPEKGMVEMQGQEWRPYSPETFLCPPFPSYVSGHSTISSACAEVLKLYTGSETLGDSIRLVPGTMTEPNRLGKPVILHFLTFTQTADMAGMSRVLGGYHIQSENIEGLRLGRNVAHEVWKFYNRHIGE